MIDPHTIVIRPRITEKTARLSYGDEREQDDTKLQRKYTFVVAPNANKIQIKQAVEAIYNAGKKKDEAISVVAVNTMNVRGRFRRVGGRSRGKKPDFKKAVVTLAPGQMLEDFGV